MQKYVRQNGYTDENDTDIHKIYDTLCWHTIQL
jgi:hypothetical protein